MCKIGKVYVIGLGPGAEKEMTYQASTALEKSEVIIGYTVYTGLPFHTNAAGSGPL
mgnify:CR=1 FL=1